MNLSMLLVFGISFIVLFCKFNLLNNKIKSEREYIIKTLSHDLRVASLAQIRALDILQKNSACEQADLVKDINDSCKYSFDMITTLLNTYKFKNGEMVLNYENFDCTHIVNQVCEKNEDFALRKNIVFEKYTDSNTYLNADKEMLLKVMSIFVQIAIKNSWQDEKINISVKNNKNLLVFSVCYKGLGFSEEEYNRIFSEKHAYTTVGHGIKMQFCKKIIEFHSGNVKIFKQGQNEIMLTFSIPRSKKQKEFKGSIPFTYSRVVM